MQEFFAADLEQNDASLDPPGIEDPNTMLGGDLAAPVGTDTDPGADPILDQALNPPHEFAPGPSAS
jgi:hypothetical protein